MRIAKKKENDFKAKKKENDFKCSNISFNSELLIKKIEP